MFSTVAVSDTVKSHTAALEKKAPFHEEMKHRARLEIRGVDSAGRRGRLPGVGPRLRGRSIFPGHPVFPE